MCVVATPALLEGYTEGAEEREYRLSLPRDAFKEEGAKIVDAFRIFLESKEGWTLEAENYEGWRATIDEGDGNKGWVLIRQVGVGPGNQLGHCKHITKQYLHAVDVHFALEQFV